MQMKIVLSMIVAAAMVVSPAFAVKKKGTGLEAPTPKQAVEKTGS